MVLISSLCLFSTASIWLRVSCSSACRFSVMFCKRKGRASYWDLPAGPAFSSFSLKITFIHPIRSALLPSSASTVTLASCWSYLELTRLSAFSACSRPCLLSPRAYVLFPFYCPSLCSLALSASPSAYAQLPTASSSTYPTSQTYLPVLLLLLHPLPELKELLRHVFPFLLHETSLCFQLTLKALHFPCKHGKWQDSESIQTVALTLLTFRHWNCSAGGICLQLLHSSEALRTESCFYTTCPRQGISRNKAREALTLYHLLGLRDCVELGFKMTPGNLQLR